jgi:hypothetical protein
MANAEGLLFQECPSPRELPDIQQVPHQKNLKSYTSIHTKVSISLVEMLTSGFQWLMQPPLTLLQIVTCFKYVYV